MLVFFLMAVFLAEILGTVAGFGSSTLLLPVAVVLFDFKTALVLVALVHIFGNVGRLVFFRGQINTRLAMYFGVCSVAGGLLGALLVSIIDQETFKALLGIFLIFYAGYELLRHRVSLPPTMPVMITGGVLSGFVAGLVGTGGAIRGAFLTAFRLPKLSYIATAAAIALAADLARLPVYLAGDFLQAKDYGLLPILVVVAVGGSYVGRKAVDRLPQELFRRLVLAAIGLVGIGFVATWLG